VRFKLPVGAAFSSIAIILIIAALITLVTFDSPRPAQGLIPFPTLPPFGLLLEVNTTSDLVDPGDGTCSLRAAIEAANINGVSGNCSASGSPAGATDGIAFEIGTGTPVINITSPLPAITDKLGIGGAGPADRVELHGPGSGTGITISGAGAAGSAIRGLVLNNFSTALYINSTSNITVAGNYFGTNAAGPASFRTAWVLACRPPARRLAD
jgi:CSLREA domain-containing protein